jgi:hypothetical protein
VSDAEKIVSSWNFGSSHGFNRCPLVVDNLLDLLLLELGLKILVFDKVNSVNNEKAHGLITAQEVW